MAESPYGRTRTWNVPSKTIGSISKVFHVVLLLIQSPDLRGYVLALRSDNAKRTIVRKDDDRVLP
jgi:hypothetical protein